MKKNLFLTGTALLLSALCVSCSSDTPTNLSELPFEVQTTSSDVNENTKEKDASSVENLTSFTSSLSPEDFFSNRDYRTEIETESPVTLTLEGETISVDGEGVTISGNIATITKEGTYILSGNLTEGQVVVDLADETEKVQLYFKGASLNCSHSAPINVVSADKVFITMADGTENWISANISKETSVDGGIFSKCDLTLNGNGILNIDVVNGDGIVAKDELTITSGTYNITSDGHGMDSNDGIAIADGTFHITSGKDGLHAEHSSNLEKGYIYIVSGNFTIDSGGDGMDTGYFLEINDGVFDIRTGGGWEEAPVKVAEPNPMAEMMMGNMDSMTDMMSMTEQMMGQMSGGSQTSREEMMSQMQGDTSQMQGQMSGMPSMDMMPDFSTLPEGFDMSNPDPEMMEEILSQLPEEMQEMMAPMMEKMLGTQTSTKEDDGLPSMKGLKSAGDLRIFNGEINLDCYDDGIHSDSNVEIHGGTFYIGTGDDGIHANWDLNIYDGEFNIYHCYEGLEGQKVHISGGFMDLVCGDDGINAASNQRNPEDSVISLTISGGTIRIDSSAEGDGLDSNDSIFISGGDILVSSTTESMDTTLGFFNETVITEGTFLATGANTMTLRNFTGESTQGSIVVTTENFQEDTVTLLDSKGNIVVEFEPVKEYSAITISSPDIVLGETYQLVAGDFEETIFMETLQYGEGMMMSMMGGGLKGDRTGR